MENLNCLELDDKYHYDDFEIIQQNIPYVQKFNYFGLYI